MKVTICTVAHLGWYRRGVARMIEAFEKVSPGYEIQAWVNTLPPGAEPIEREGVSYTGYGAKPWALWHALKDADVALLIDASVYPIKHIEPLLDFIKGHGYYIAPTGNSIGEWCNDAMLAKCGLDRNHALKISECASGVVGLANNERNLSVARQWCETTRWDSFPGHHTNAMAARANLGKRNIGHVSYDGRCSGHRQDQSALALIAWQNGLLDLTPWPRFVAYQCDYRDNAETCMLISGM